MRSNKPLCNIELVLFSPLYDYCLQTNAGPTFSTNFRDTSCSFAMGERKRRMLTAQHRDKRETEIRYIRKRVETKIVCKSRCRFWREDREMKTHFYPECHNKRGEACSLKSVKHILLHAPLERVTCPATLILPGLMTVVVLKSSWGHFLQLSFISSIFGSVLPSALSSLYFSSCYSFRAMFAIFNPLSGAVK